MNYLLILLSSKLSASKLSKLSNLSVRIVQRLGKVLSYTPHPPVTSPG